MDCLLFKVLSTFGRQQEDVTCKLLLQASERRSQSDLTWELPVKMLQGYVHAFTAVYEVVSTQHAQSIGNFSTGLLLLLEQSHGQAARLHACLQLL